MAEADFYDSLDLRYIEVGVALKKIDRNDPGVVPFAVPVLMPELSIGDPVDSKIIQRGNPNLMNENPGAVEVSDLTVCNYISIEIPKELCALPRALYKMDRSYIKFLNGSVDISDISAYGTVYNHSWNHDHGHATEEGVTTLHRNDDPSVSEIYLRVKEQAGQPYEDRWIKKFSRWAIAFIGGDINSPCVLARLPGYGTK